MNTQALSVAFVDESQAMQCIRQSIAPYCKQRWAEGAGRLSVVIQPQENDRSLRQNRFLWGFVYKHISEQALIAGIGATTDGWHLYYKRMFLGYKFTKTVLPGKKRPSVTKELRSSTDLKVKPMSAFLEKVMAHAATTFDVSFPADMRWEDWRE